MTDTVVIQTEQTEVVESQAAETTTLVLTTEPEIQTVEVSLGLVGPQGPQGPPGADGADGVTSFNGRTGTVVLEESDVTAVNTYTQDVMIPTSSIVIDHGLGCYPSVTVISSSGETVMADVQYIDDNHVQISFAGANVFTVYCN
jgi:hypothetical protein